MRKVLVPHGERKKLAALFNVSMVSVRKALAGTTHSDLAKRICKAAVERGGVYVDDHSKKDTYEKQRP